MLLSVEPNVQLLAFSVAHTGALHRMFIQGHLGHGGVDVLFVFLNNAYASKSRFRLTHTLRLFEADTVTELTGSLS